MTKRISPAISCCMAAVWSLFVGLSIAAVPPGAPTAVVAMPGDGRATVSFTVPASDGDSPITQFTVTASPGSASVTGKAIPIVVFGLTNGTTYTFTVKASNASGSGPASAPSNPVTPILSTITPSVGISQSFGGALDAHGQVYAWGSDGYGQLGQGRQLQQTTPFKIAGLPPIKQIALSEHALAIDTSGQVWSWGEDCSGQLGPRGSAPSSRPARVIGAFGMIRVAAGLCASYALKSDGTVWTWTSSTVRQITGLSGIIEISTSGGNAYPDGHTLALKSDGTVWAFGGNLYGQLGIETTSNSSLPVQVPLRLPPGVKVKAISAPVNASAVLLSNGEVLFWGTYSYFPQLVTAPTALTGLGGSAVAIWASSGSVTALRTDGTVWRWSRSLGSPYLYATRNNAVLVTGSPNGNGLFTIDSNGALVGSGSNNSGQLAQGNTSVVTGDVSIPGFTSGTTLVCLGYISGNVLALKADGTVWFWGENSAGQRGDELATASSVPLAVPIAVTIKAISIAENFGLALDTSGQVWGWGWNSGMVLNADQVNRSTPTPIAGATNVTAMSAGPTTAVYVRGDKTAWIGGVVANTSGGFRQVAGLSNIVGVAAAGENAFFLREDGVLFGIGNNRFGELGDGTTTDRSSPVPVLGIVGKVIKVVAASLRIAALTSDGRIYQWGADVSGGTLTGGTNLPVQIAGIADAIDIAVGRDGGLIRRADGSVMGWGRIGLASTLTWPPANPTTLLPIAFHEPVTGIAIGQNGSGYFIGSTGLLWGWGMSVGSQAFSTVGDGTYIQRTSPVVIVAHSGGGSLDGNNWYLDLQPATPEAIPSSATPTVLVTTHAASSGSPDEPAVSLTGTVRYNVANIGRSVNNFVLGLVPPAFIGLVNFAQGTSSMEVLKAKAAKNGGLVLVQLTPSGWTDVKGQLIAYSSGLASAGGGASNILNGINTSSIPGARFCIGYGETADAMLSAQALREVFVVEGATSTVANIPCVLSGVYVGGPPTSNLGSPATFTATVVGVSPTGAAQFSDRGGNIGSSVPLSAKTAATATASLTTSSLLAGAHSIGASFSGDTQNPAASSQIPLLHVVSAVRTGSTIALSGPASSMRGDAATFTATVTGNSPTGTVQFMDGGTSVGSPVTVVNSTAALNLSTLAEGSHIITAAYSGDGTNTGSMSNHLAHRVYLGIQTMLTLSSSATSLTAGTPVTYTATVTGINPTGSVTFRDVAMALGTVPIANGVATLKVESLDAGLHVITADYSGDENNQIVTSEPLFQLVALGSLADVNVRSTVTSYYQKILGRSPDQAGLDFWTTEATRVKGLGADVREVFFAMAMAFFSSSEYVGRNTSDTQYITDLYGTFFNRTPDASGLAYWQGELTASGSRIALLNSFLFSAEFSNQMTALFGASGVRPELTLAIDFFRGVFGRLPDSAGFNYWLGRLRTAQCQGAAAVGAEVNNIARQFFNSSEYLARSRSNRDFTGDVYNAYLRRGPGGDSAGFNYWVGQVSTLGREGVRVQFVPSAEFQSRVGAVVNAGCVQ